MSDSLAALTALITSLPADVSPYDAIAKWLRASVTETLPHWFRGVRCRWSATTALISQVIIVNAVVFGVILLLALGTLGCKIYDRQACASRRS